MNWDLQKIYFNYLMGAYNSQYVLDDWNTPRIGYSLDNKLSDWDYQDKPKNYDYWFGKDRFTYISRQHYKNDFVKGYVWGRYPIKNSLDNINETDRGNNEESTETDRGNNEESTETQQKERAF